MHLRRQVARFLRSHFDCDVYWHDAQRDPDERGWRSGRSWFHVATPPRIGASQEATTDHCLHCEWYLPGRHPGFALEVGHGDSDRGVLLHLGLGLGDLYLMYEPLPESWIARLLPGEPFRHQWGDVVYEGVRRPSRELHLNFHSGAVWWCLWMNDDEWRSTDPRWRRGSFAPLDWLFGRTEYTRETLSRTEVEIPLYERSYPAVVTLERSTWKRPRWPLVQMRPLAQIELSEPPTFPGKGENGWDLDDDAIYAMGCDASTVSEAIGRYVAAVLRNRQRYGGSLQWQPRSS